MALAYTESTGSRVNHGAFASAFTSVTFIWWMYPTSLSAVACQYMGIFTAGPPARSVPLIFRTDVLPDELRVIFRRDGNVVYETNNANLTTGKWWYIAVVIDSGASAGNLVKVYLGDLATLATARTFGVANDSTGTFLSNAGRDFVTGDAEAISAAFGGSIARLLVWPGVALTEAQVQAQQFRATPIVAGCELHSEYGYNGTGDQPDWSGFANTGVVTSATVADHVPIPFRRVGQLYVPYAVSAAAGFIATRPFVINQAPNRAATY